MKSGSLSRRALLSAGLALMGCGGPAMADEPLQSPTGAPAVTLLKTPQGGIQPQAVVDAGGALHLVYFKGKPMMGDLFYVRSMDWGSTFTAPLQVNSQPGSAIATGTIRGAQLAVGKDNRVHVAWNGSRMAEPRGPGGTPMLYTRMADDGSGFEPQRNLIAWAGGLDGGGSVAADATGHVYVAWHGAGETAEEGDRAVYLARSKDEGRSFERERKINPEPTGVCACCQLRAFVDRKGTLSVVYRTARDMMDRDSVLLVSTDGGEKFAGALLHPWRIGACPMSSYALSEGTKGLRAAWETAGQIHYSTVQTGPVKFSEPAPAPGNSNNRKHPVLVEGKDGTTLLAWTEGTGWNRGGSLAWQVLDANGQPTAQKGRAAGVPVWGLLTAVARRDGRFVLFY